MSVRFLEEYKSNVDYGADDKYLYDVPVSSSSLETISDSVMDRIKDVPDDVRVFVNGDSFVLNADSSGDLSYYLHVPETGSAHIICSYLYEGYEPAGQGDLINVYGSTLDDDELERALDSICHIDSEPGITQNDNRNWLLVKAQKDDLGIGDTKEVVHSSSSSILAEELVSRLRDNDIFDFDEFTNVRHDLALDGLSDKTREYAGKLADAGLCVVVPNVNTVAVLMDTNVEHGVGASGTYFIDTREHGSYLLDFTDGSDIFAYADHEAAFMPTPPDVAKDIRRMLVEDPSALAAAWHTDNWYESGSCDTACRLSDVVGDFREENLAYIDFDLSKLIDASTPDYPVWSDVTCWITNVDDNGHLHVSELINEPELSDDVREALSELNVSDNSGHGNDGDDGPMFS